VITVSHLAFEYPARPVLRDVSFEARDGSVLAALGPNGAGKTTLFRCMLGVLKGYTGEVKAGGVDIKTLSAKEMASQMAYVPQASNMALDFTAFDIVLAGTASSLSLFALPRAGQKAAAERAMEMLGIQGLRDRGYSSLSGGEKQLVLLARALAQEAKALILDEPTASLDYGNQVRVMSAIKGLAREGYTVILSTHQPDHAFLYADYALALNGGISCRYGPPNEVIDEDLIEALYGIRARIEKLEGSNGRICVPLGF